MHPAITQLQTIRQGLVALAQSVDEDALHQIPAGFPNNMLWHLSHLVVTQQLLCYGLAGQPLLVDEALVAGNRKATSPADWRQAPDPTEICTLLTTLPERLASDHAAGCFATIAPYETSAGIALTTIDEVLCFNNFHEGIHLGQLLAMRRILAQTTAD